MQTGYFNTQRVFRQFFDTRSSTYTYLLADLNDRVALFIDTVKECVDRDLSIIQELKLDRIYLLNTHIHADHITGNAAIKDKLGSKASSLISKYYDDARADIYVGENDVLEIGSFRLNFLHTPGHTSGCLSIVDHDNARVFTGDALLIRGCGRTDFQGGSPEQLYESIHTKLFTLPRSYIVYPAHDYRKMTNSSIGEEMELNTRLNKTKSEYVKLMNNLNLAYPKLIDVAVPHNLNCGYDLSPDNNQ